MRTQRLYQAILLACIVAISGCAALGAATGGYVGYELGCDENDSREECAAATAGGAVGGGIIGGAVDRRR